MSKETMPLLPLRPHMSVHATAGHYCIRMTADAEQAPFCIKAADGSAELTAAGETLLAQWQEVQYDYDNIVLDTLAVSPKEFACLVYMYTDATDDDHDLCSAEEFLAENADSCPCCAALHEDQDFLGEMHTYYEFHGSIGEYVEDLRLRIPRAVTKETGRHGQQFWADISIEPYGHASRDFEPERMVLRAYGFSIEETYNQYDRRRDFAQNDADVQD